MNDFPAGKGQIENTITSRLIASVAVAIIFVSYFLYWEWQNPGYNPDKYYHYGISKITAEGGLINSLPQVDDLDWGKYFPEKEFLFHVVTALGFKAFDSQGVKAVCFLMSILSMLLILNYCMKYLPVFQSILLVVCLGLFTNFFNFRLSFVRPHVLSILCFVILYIGLLKNSRKVSFIGGLLFSLAYHTFYIPIALVFISSISKAIKREKIYHSEILALSGIVIGIFINPYFPSQLILGFEHLKYALFPNPLHNQIVGSELIRKELVYYLKYFSHFIFLFLIFCIDLIKRLQGKKPNDKIYYLTAGTFFLFFVLTLKNYRAIEYLVPATLFYVITIFINQDYTSKTKSFLLAIFLAIPGPFFFADALKDRNIHFQTLEREIINAINKIPTSVSSQKVYTCNFVLGEFLLYYRPDLKFVDVLDPRLLQSVSSEKFELRQKINANQYGHVSEVLKSVFKAHYVLCTQDETSRFMLETKQFELLYPTNALDSRVRLLKIL